MKPAGGVELSDLALCRQLLRRGFAGGRFARCLDCQHPPMPFDVVSNGRKMNLQLCFGKAHPSHGAKTIAAFPGAKNFFNARPDRPQRAIVRFERFREQPAMALAQELRGPALRFDGLFGRERIIGLVAIDLTRIIGNDRGRDIDIGLVGRRRLDLSDDSRVLVGGDMGLIAMCGRTAFMLNPGRFLSPLLAEPITVASISVPLRIVAPFCSRSRAIAAKRLLSSPCATSARRKRTKAVRSGVASSREKPQKRRKLARSESASAKATSERSCQVASNSALNIAKGGQAFSPFAAG